MISMTILSIFVFFVLAETYLDLKFEKYCTEFEYIDYFWKEAKSLRVVVLFVWAEMYLALLLRSE